MSKIFILFFGFITFATPNPIMPLIGTPVMVVDMSQALVTTSITSLTGTPSEHSMILCFVASIDNVSNPFNVPTDTWANTAPWTELLDVENNFARIAVSWTTTGLSPGSGAVTVNLTAEAPDIGIAIVEITGVQLRSPHINDNSGTSAISTLSITVSGTLGENDVMISGIISRNDTDGITPTGNNNELDDEPTGGAQSSSIQVQYNTTDLVASWSALNALQNVGVAVHVRGHRNLKVGDSGIKVRLLSYTEFLGGKRVL